MSDEIERVVVVVPAHDEEVHVGECVRAATRACEEVGAVSGGVLVVANRCTDQTVERARVAGAQVVASGAPNVGAARHQGVLHAIESAAGAVPPERLWVAGTDADSLVPPTWLRTQLAEARRGADAFLGTIMLGLEGLREHPRWVAEYLRVSAAGDHHGHVHGANLGVRASTYLAAGGFPPVDVHEDRRFVAALLALGARLSWVETEPVRTSERHDARVSEGVGRDLLESG